MCCGIRRFWKGVVNSMLNQADWVHFTAFSFCENQDENIYAIWKFCSIFPMTLPKLLPYLLKNGIVKWHNLSHSVLFSLKSLSDSFRWSCDRWAPRQTWLGASLGSCCDIMSPEFWWEDDFGEHTWHARAITCTMPWRVCWEI